MGRTLGIIAVKGGVGKTTISSSLAADLVNHRAKKVLLVDANYNAPNLGLHMDIVEPDKTIHDVLSGRVNMNRAIHNSFGVDVVPGSYVYNHKLNYLKLKDKLKSIKKNYDFVIIDSSPSLNDEILSSMLASDDLFVVTTPDYPTLSCSFSAALLAKQRGKPIMGMILNKLRNPRYELSAKEIEESSGIPVVAKIPDDKKNVKALFTRIPTSVYNRRGKFAKEIGKLSSALVGEEERKGLNLLKPRKFRLEEVNRQLLKENYYSRRFGN
jgi:septum site-determining protein MinD